MAAWDLLELLSYANRDKRNAIINYGSATNSHFGLRSLILIVTLN